MTKKARRDVLLLGATGLVGGECLSLLLADGSFHRVVTLTRRALTPAGAQIAPGTVFENHVIDFSALSLNAGLFEVNLVISCLGTTIKKAGSEQNFRRVDFDFPLEAARLARDGGASQFLLVSSLGADPGSRIFYNRVKGELEDALIGLGFRQLTILRPSLLAGERREFRLGEEIGKRLGFLFPARFRPVEARAVAACLLDRARRPRSGLETIESASIAAFEKSVPGVSRRERQH
ncbi:MAG: NAD-dependent dehydratase [Thermoanaerobaculia bacterium]|nr:NAD-dependent dehydratase [Thermoanaerobaculia bacterium]